MVRIGICASVLLIVAFGVLNSMNTARGASNEFLRGRDCKAEANWALMLFRDRDTGVTINVMPRDQSTLDIVMTHKGTRDELWWKVYGACSGQKT